jgi:predicted HTH transcriptional regulator
VGYDNNEFLMFKWGDGRIMTLPESNRIEYKRELTDSLEKEVIAFLNYRDGGILYLGIDDSAEKVYGIADCDSVQLKIKDRLKNNIIPSCLGLFDVIH